MKYTLKFILFFFFSNWILAQSACYKLQGYWATTSHNYDSSLLFNSASVLQQGIFFQNCISLQREIFILNDNKNSIDTLVYKSKYRRGFLKHDLSFFPRNSILSNNGHYKAIDKFKSNIHFLSDTSFVLLNNTFYKKSIQALKFQDLRSEPPGGFYLQNNTRQSKLIKIPCRKLTIQIDESSFPGDQLNRLNSTECLFDSIQGDSIKITLLSEEIELEHRNRFSSLSTNYYAGSFNKVHKMVATKDIIYVNMKSPVRHTLSQVGTVLMSAAVVLIVSSPFAGIQMNDANRATIRNQVFTAGISCFGVSLPFFIVGRNKKYNISTAYPSKKENYWTIIQR
jgi:hypothetical protein